MDQVAQVDLVVQEEVDTAAKVAIHNRIKETLKSQEWENKLTPISESASEVLEIPSQKPLVTF